MVDKDNINLIIITKIKEKGTLLTFNSILSIVHLLLLYKKYIYKSIA